MWVVYTDSSCVPSQAVAQNRCLAPSKQFCSGICEYSCFSIDNFTEILLPFLFCHEYLAMENVALPIVAEVINIPGARSNVITYFMTGIF